MSVENLVRARACSAGHEVVLWWTGDIYAWVDKPQHLFGFVGMSAARAVRTDAGYQIRCQEIARYLDPHDRTILSQWANPFTEKTVDVMHVHNNPANIFVPHAAPVKQTKAGESMVFTVDVLLAYPSPLSVAEFPENSASDLYRAMELFQLFSPVAALDDPAQTSVPMALSWTRVSPWLPWMAMGQRDGALVFHCRGAKSNRAEIPEQIADAAASIHAPDTWEQPNESSWTAFKKAATA